VAELTKLPFGKQSCGSREPFTRWGWKGACFILVELMNTLPTVVVF